MQADQVALGVEPGRQLGHRRGMVLAVRHVLFARPDELDRRAGHLLGREHRLAHIVRATAPAEAAAQHELVDLALGDRQAGRFRRRGQGRLAVLRAAPDLALLRREARCGVHRLHGDMVLVGEAVDGFDLLGRALDRLLRVARLVADEGFLGVEALLQGGVDRLGRDLAQVTDVPVRRDRVERCLGLPVGVGHHHHRVPVDGEDLLHARHLLGLAGVEVLELAADHRAGAHGRVEHPRHGVIHAVDLLARDLVDRVEPLQRLARDLPVLRVLEFHVLGRLEFGRRRGDRAVGQCLARPLVRDGAAGRAAFGGWHVPLLGCGRDQHLARDGAALADILLALADAAAAAGREILPDAVALQVLAGRRILPGDLVPVAVELLGHELAEAGERALAHFGAGDADHHLVVGMDDHPGVQFLDGLGMCHVLIEGQMEAEREATGNGGAADQEAATAERSLDRHDASSP